MVRTIARSLIAVGFILLVAVLFASSCEGSPEVLERLNARRQARGLRPFVYDAGLDAECEQNAKYRAARRISGHCTSVPPLRGPEGVGWGGRDFISCFAWTRTNGNTQAGAASHYAGGRWYHTLRISGAHSGSATGSSRSYRSRRRGLFRRRR